MDHNQLDASDLEASRLEVTEEEYADFYKHISRDWEAPFDHLRFKAEGTFEYDALLFIPDRQPFDLFYREQDYGLQLYVNRVLIKENADELLPSWLRFIKGVADSPDLRVFAKCFKPIREWRAFARESLRK